MTESLLESVMASPAERRWEAASRVKRLARVNLPLLPDWNYGPCRHHSEATPSCEYRACGGDFFDHQTKSIAWFYMAHRGLDQSSTGLGKAQPLNAGVLTPEGYLPMGEVTVDTTVLTPDGTPAKVLQVFPQPEQQIYRVTLNDGSTTRATGEHLWTVLDGPGQKMRVKTLTTDQLIATGLHLHNSPTRLRYALPPVIINDREAETSETLPLDPYALGALLGDGSFTTGSLQFTAAEDEQVELLRETLRAPIDVRKVESTPYNYTVSGGQQGGVTNYVTSYLREAGLWQRTYHDKFIPARYLLAAYDARLELLQGLLDTDGHVTEQGAIEFSSVSETLSSQVADLVRSLGGYARVVEKATTWTHNGVKRAGVTFRVSLNMPVCPFRLSRHVARYRTPQKNRRILSIEPDGFEAAQCILIDHPDHLYVTDNYIPTHNTNTALGTLCLIKHQGETLKTVIVCATPAVNQWAAEAQRFAPGLDVAHVSSGLSKPARLALYAGNWEVLIIGFHLFTRDIDALAHVEVNQLVSDDVDPILNPKNKTAKAVNRVASQCERVLTFNATSLQTRLQQLWAATQPIGGSDVFGTIGSFEKRYVKREPVWIRIGTNRDGTAQMQKTMQMTGYKNLNDFRSKFAPMTIRHSYESVRGDMGIPSIMPPQIIPLDMHPAQRAKYDQLQEGVLDLMRKDEPPQQKMVSARTAFTYGGQICTGLPALGEEDGPGASIKLDWVEEKIQGDWEHEKVVVFARNIGTVEALQQRLQRLQVGYSTIWGKENNADARAAEVTRFWNDANTRVLIGTAAVERSLNLHCASIICFLDVHMNPARMNQLIGRIRRAGSVHPHVWTFYPTIENSQESRYLKVLGARQLLVDRVNDEDDAGLFESLSPDEILRLIQP